MCLMKECGWEGLVGEAKSGEKAIVSQKKDIFWLRKGIKRKWVSGLAIRTLSPPHIIHFIKSNLTIPLSLLSLFLSNRPRVFLSFSFTLLSIIHSIHSTHSFMYPTWHAFPYLPSLFLFLSITTLSLLRQKFKSSRSFMNHTNIRS